MNFLAHLFLSGNNENLLIGNFIADMIQNKELPTLNKNYIGGIELHRKIDNYTDQHPMFRRGVIRLRPTQRKYAPVVLDILFDYLLARHWDRYSKQDLDQFIRDKYQVLEGNLSKLPPLLQHKIPLMIADNFLHQYTSFEGLTKAMRRMDLRTRFPSQFVSSVEELKNNFSEFSGEFNELFPDLISHVEEYHAS